MKIVSGESSREVTLEFETLSDFEAFFEQADKNGVFEINVETLAADAILMARCADSPRSRRIRPLAVRRLAHGYEIQTRVASPVQKTPVPTPDPPAAARPEAQTENENPAFRQSLQDRIRALPATERVTLALKADLMERRVLMKENNSKINEFLLRNVHITDHEIAFMARNAAAPMQTILAIANHREWMSRDTIRAAILSNPRTPAAMVLEWIPTLSSGDLIRMSHARYLREDVQNSIKTEMKKRGIRPKRVAD